MLFQTDSFGQEDRRGSELKVGSLSRDLPVGALGRKMSVDACSVWNACRKADGCLDRRVLQFSDVFLDRS